MGPQGGCNAACSGSTWVSSVSRLRTGAKQGPWECFSPLPWDEDICPLGDTRSPPPRAFGTTQAAPVPVQLPARQGHTGNLIRGVLPPSPPNTRVTDWWETFLISCTNVCKLKPVLSFLRHLPMTWHRLWTESLRVATTTTANKDGPQYQNCQMRICPVLAYFLDGYGRVCLEIEVEHVVVCGKQRNTQDRGWQWGARCGLGTPGVALRLSVHLWLRARSWILGSSPTSGSLHGACFSLPPMYLQLSLSLMNNFTFKKNTCKDAWVAWHLIASLQPQAWSWSPRIKSRKEPASFSACVSSSLSYE